MEHPSQYLVLTATVTPNMTKKLVITDPAVRLGQYQDALTAWTRFARSCGARVVVVETSGADPDCFTERLDAADHALVDFIHYDPTAAVVDRGIGYIEWAAIRHALDRLGLGADETVYKVTGRLVVTNPERVFGRLGPSDVRLRSRIDGAYCDTRVVGASAAVWRDVLLPAAEDVDYPRRLEIEHTVAARVRSARTLRTATVSPFPRRPHFAGRSGTNGSTYRPWKTALQGYLVRPVEVVAALVARSFSS